MRHLPLFAALLLLVLTAVRSEACTCVVDPYGTGDYPTIQAAIAAAEDGDVICLTDGTFTGDGNRDIDYLGKAITVRSQSGSPERCIIDCQGNVADPHRAFYFHSEEGLGSVLEGVTITHGHASWDWPEGKGGAVFCTNSSSPTVVACRFLDNVGEYGGGVWCEWCIPTFTDCVFAGNASETFGGGMGCSASSATLERCIFVGNTAQWGGGLFCGGSGTSPVLRNVTFFGNSAWDIGAGVFCRARSSPVLERTIIAFSEQGGSFACDLNANDPGLTCCDIYGNEGGDWVGCIADQYGINGNFCVGPLFCGPVDGSTPMIHSDASQYSLHANSPCLPGNHPDGYDCGVIGAHGQGCGYAVGPVVKELRVKREAGAVETLTWGRIKAGYRR